MVQGISSWVKALSTAATKRGSITLRGRVAPGKSTTPEYCND